LFEGRFEIVDDSLGKNVGIGKIVGLFKAFVSEPEDVDVDFVAVDEFFVMLLAPANLDRKYEDVRIKPYNLG
jgi:hypothetical protein